MYVFEAWGCTMPVLADLVKDCAGECDEGNDDQRPACVHIEAVIQLMLGVSPDSMRTEAAPHPLLECAMTPDCNAAASCYGAFLKTMCST